MAENEKKEHSIITGEQQFWNGTLNGMNEVCVVCVCEVNKNIPLLYGRNSSNTDVAHIFLSYAWKFNFEF